jgi:hypothetical protein
MSGNDEGPKLHYVQIRTEKSHYVMPRVHLERFKEQLLAHKAYPYANPCLQIINEDASVLSIVWDHVVEINVSHLMVTEGVAGYRLETLWTKQSPAPVASTVSPKTS